MQVEKLSEDNCMLPLHVVFVCPVTVPVLIASLKVTATVVPMATPEAELAGVVLDIVGGVVSGAIVVKLRTTSLPRALSEKSWAVLLMHMLYCVLAANVPGLNRNVVFEADGVIEPVIGAAAQFVPDTKYKLVVVIDGTFIDSENCTLMSVFVAIPVALFAGVVAETVGAVESTGQLLAPHVPSTAVLRIKSLRLLLLSTPFGARDTVRFPEGAGPVVPPSPQLVAPVPLFPH